MNKVFISLLLVAGLFFIGCEKKTPKAKDTGSSGNPLTAPVDYLGATAKAKKLADKTVDAAGIKKAIGLFQAQEGRNPKNLNELVGDYLPKMPEPPVGMKFDYNPATGDFKVVPK